MSGYPNLLPVTIRVPLIVMRRIGDLASMIARRTSGEAWEAAVEIEQLVDIHASADVAQLAEIAEHGT